MANSDDAIPLELWSHERGHRISVKLGDLHDVRKGQPRITRLWFATCTCHPRWIGRGPTREAALQRLRDAATKDATQ